jgi:energy-coupling factor transporter ATP-binding protein EcfA2
MLKIAFVTSPATVYGNHHDRGFCHLFLQICESLMTLRYQRNPQPFFAAARRSERGSAASAFVFCPRAPTIKGFPVAWFPSGLRRRGVSLNGQKAGIRMKLSTVRVTNFRSIEDSGEFEVGQLLCLVGKNEAGKTAIEQALAGLNPHPSTPVAYDLERDFPRRFLADYEELHPDKAATVVTTKWTLSREEKEAIGQELGMSAVTNEPVTVYRRYGDKEPQWEPHLDYQQAVKNLIEKEKLGDEERQPLAEAKNSSDLIKALEGLPERSQKQERLLERFKKYPNQTMSSFVLSILKPKLPQFMYSSHYDRMVGQIRIDLYPRRLAGQLQPSIDAGERVFVDFLEYAGTSIDEITAAKTYEALNARCEAASNKITLQLQGYWKQNPFLEIDVRVTKAEPNDPAPFNEGVVARARVRNTLHKVTVPFSERSAGFIWFFSFLVKFAQVRKTGANLILLLDEPGLTLHGKAQADLLRYFEEKLTPDHQVIYTTHSPFMVPPDDLPSVRIVEDKLFQPAPGQWSSEGTKVRDDTMATDRDTLFPLQGALGYEMTQTLFVGKHTLLVEGAGDILYLESWSSALVRRGKNGLDRRWTPCPAGGIDRIQPFVALFAGQKLDIAALSDYAKGDKRKVDSLRQNKVMEGEKLLTFATVLGVDEADIENVLSPALYAKILNQAYNLVGGNELTAQKLLDADQNTTRLVKKAEAYFRLLPPGTPEFDHFTPADWLFRRPELLDGDAPEVAETLARAEKVLAALNKLLPAKA